MSIECLFKDFMDRFPMTFVRGSEHEWWKRTMHLSGTPLAWNKYPMTWWKLEPELEMPTRKEEAFTQMAKKIILSSDLSDLRSREMWMQYHMLARPLGKLVIVALHRFTLFMQ